MFNPDETKAPESNNRFKYKGDRPRSITVSVPFDLHGAFYDAADRSKVGPSTFAAKCIRYALANLPPP